MKANWKAAIVFVLVAASPALRAENFASCIIDDVADVANDVVAQAVYRNCLSKHPGGWSSVKQGSGRWPLGLIGYRSGDACAVEEGKDIRSTQAARMLRRACNTLFNKPSPPIFDPFTARPAKPNYFDQFDPIVAGRSAPTEKGQAASADPQPQARESAPVFAPEPPKPKCEWKQVMSDEEVRICRSQK